MSETRGADHLPIQLRKLLNYFIFLSKQICSMLKYNTSLSSIRMNNHDLTTTFSYKKRRCTVRTVVKMLFIPAAVAGE